MECMFIKFAGDTRLGEDESSLRAGLLSKGTSIVWRNGPEGTVRNPAKTKAQSWEGKTQCNNVVCDAAL